MGVSDIWRERRVPGHLVDQEDRQRPSRLDAIADPLPERFKARMLRRASMLEQTAEHRPEPRPLDEILHGCREGRER